MSDRLQQSFFKPLARCLAVEQRLMELIEAGQHSGHASGQAGVQRDRDTLAPGVPILRQPSSARVPVSVCSPVYFDFFMVHFLRLTA